MSIRSLYISFPSIPNPYLQRPWGVIPSDNRSSLAKNRSNNLALAESEQILTVECRKTEIILCRCGMTTVAAMQVQGTFDGNAGLTCKVICA